MSKIKLNKIEAARRQLDAAIRMLFANEDPVAIHTLCMAAFRILRDLAAKRGDSYIHKVTQASIRPGMEKEFWAAMHVPSNFLKHADRDADAILDEVDEKVNDIIILLACLYYRDLGYQLTPEMIVLMSWVYALYPNFLKDDIQSLLKTHLEQAKNSLVGKSRQDQLSVGLQLLQVVRNLPRY